MKKVTKKNKFFKVIPEAKLVIGEMRGTTVSNEVENAGINYKQATLIQWASTVLGQDYDMFSTIQGNAYCDERDEFDEHVGIEVASSKLDLKKHKKMAKRYWAIYRLLVDASTTAHKLYEKHHDKAQAITEDLDRHYGRGQV